MQLAVLSGIMSTLLASDKIVNADYLSEKYEMSKRTIYRYIAALSEGGLPIESCLGRNGGWRIVDTYRMRANLLTDTEFLHLMAAIAQSPLSDDPAVQSAKLKLMALKRVSDDQLAAKLKTANLI